MVGTPAGRRVGLDVWQHLGIGQGFSQGRDQARRSDVGFNITAVLQCETLARGAPSWPRQNST